MPVELFIGSIWVMVKKPDSFDTRVHGKINGIRKGGVPPAPGLVVLLFSILCVMNQKICSSEYLYEVGSLGSALMLKADFIVRNKNECLIPFAEFVAKSAVSVIQGERMNLNIAKTAVSILMTGVDTFEVNPGIHGVKLYREVRRIHLMGEIIPDCTLGVCSGTESYLIFPGICRGEKRKPQQMIPVGMCEEKTDLTGLLFNAEGFSKISQAGAGIDNKDLAGL